VTDGDDGLRSLLETLDPRARDDLRRVLIRDQADRDAISSRLMRDRDERGDDWADIIDRLTLDPEALRRVIWFSPAGSESADTAMFVKFVLTLEFTS
jgi:hypothetical protein